MALLRQGVRTETDDEFRKLLDRGGLALLVWLFRGVPGSFGGL